MTRLLVSLCCLLSLQLSAQLAFDTTSKEFDSIYSGEVVRVVYNFTNESDSAVTIEKVRTSCGCSVPTFNQEPIQPGQRDSIVLVFNSLGKQGMQNKKAWVVIKSKRNYELPPIKLKGFVKDILLTQYLSAHTADMRETNVQTIRIMNYGKQVVHVDSVKSDCPYLTLAIDGNSVSKTDTLNLEIKLDKAIYKARSECADRPTVDLYFRDHLDITKQTMSIELLMAE